MIKRLLLSYQEVERLLLFDVHQSKVKSTQCARPTSLKFCGPELQQSTGCLLFSDVARYVTYWWEQNRTDSSKNTAHSTDSRGSQAHSCVSGRSTHNSKRMTQSKWTSRAEIHCNHLRSGLWMHTPKKILSDKGREREKKTKEKQSDRQTDSQLNSLTDTQKDT